MDPLTLVGILGALVLLLVGIVMEGTNPASLIGIPAFLIVIIPTVLVSIAGLKKGDLSAVTASVKKGLFGKVAPIDGAIDTVVQFADTARRDGLLALEEPAKSVEDPFLRKGIELAVDGTDPEQLRDILELELMAKQARAKVGAKFFTDMGGFAPTLGIVGAVVGLIHVLGHLENPAQAGEGIAAAFIATFYGVGFANLVFFPISNKLKRVAEAETSSMELLMEGVLSIQAGANPRVIEQKLRSFVPAKEGGSKKSKKGGAGAPEEEQAA